MIDKLHYISQPAEDGTHITAINRALKAGCKWIQLRIKNQPTDEVIKQAIEAKKLCSQYGAKLIVNDHPEVALEVAAHGVHLGLQDMSVLEARRIIGERKMIIGGTANTFEHIQKRANEGVDYIGCGPYRFTTTKTKLSPILGLPGLKAIIIEMRNANITIPIIGIGGILPEDISLLMDAGLYGVAMSGAITKAPESKSLVDYTYQQLNTLLINEPI